VLEPGRVAEETGQDQLGQARGRQGPERRLLVGEAGGANGVAQAGEAGQQLHRGRREAERARGGAARDRARARSERGRRAVAEEQGERGRADAEEHAHRLAGEREPRDRAGEAEAGPEAPGARGRGRDRPRADEDPGQPGDAEVDAQGVEQAEEPSAAAEGDAGEPTGARPRAQAGDQPRRAPGGEQGVEHDRELERVGGLAGEDQPGRRIEERVVRVRGDRLAAPELRVPLRQAVRREALQAGVEREIEVGEVARCDAGRRVEERPDQERSEQGDEERGAAPAGEVPGRGGQRSAVAHRFRPSSKWPNAIRSIAKPARPKYQPRRPGV
jgi:hypothetical protein